MKNQTTNSSPSALSHFIKATSTVRLLPALLLILTTPTSYARRTTWDLNPISGDWNTAANWTPSHVPGGEDTAIFAVSNQTDVSLSAVSQVNGIVFDPGASAFTISCTGVELLFNGRGIKNSSGSTQNFVADSTSSSAGGISFSQSSTAGSLTNFTVNGAPAGGLSGAVINFLVASSAGNATYTVNGGQEHGGQISFSNTSTAGNAIITTNGGIVGSPLGGGLISFNGSTAGTAGTDCVAFVEKIAANNPAIQFRNRVCRQIHGHDRGGELLDAISQGTATLVEHGGRVTGYATVIGFFGHAVGESNKELEALIGAATTFPGPGFLLPTRNTDLFRWCLQHGLRVTQPMTLMSLGLYNNPAGAFLPSILY